MGLTYYNSLATSLSLTNRRLLHNCRFIPLLIVQRVPIIKVVIVEYIAYETKHPLSKLDEGCFVFVELDPLVNYVIQVRGRNF